MNGRPRGRFHAAITRWFSDPTTGRGQPRANRAAHQRHHRLPSAPRRGGGNAELGCRLAPVYRTTGNGRNAGSCQPPELLFEVYWRQVAEGGVSPAFHCPQSGSRMTCESRLAFRACGRRGSALDGISAISWLLLLPGPGNARMGSGSAASHLEKDQSRERGGERPSPPTPSEPWEGTVAARALYRARHWTTSLSARARPRPSSVFCPPGETASMVRVASERRRGSGV